MNKTIILMLFLTLSAHSLAQGLQTGSGFIEVQGGPVWYEISGNGTGIPIMMLHGGPGGTSCAFSNLSLIGEEWPIIRYDQLGSGRSGRPNDMSLWQVDRFVQELHTIRMQLGVEKMHLLGHSWGGALAAAYVLEKGTEGITSLIFSSPLLSTPLWIEDANYLRSLLPEDIQNTLDAHEKAGTLDSDEYQTATDEFYRRHVFGGDRITPPANCLGVTGNSEIYEYMWGPTEFFANGTLTDFDLSNRLHEIDVPVLFIAGEFDEARPERMRQFQQLIPGAQLMIIEDAAHASYRKKPEEYAAALQSFLEAVDSEN
ncbi:MAG: proline iminopeptidase-family hydrolase [Pseudohongiellaceae bacterium]